MEKAMQYESMRAKVYEHAVYALEQAKTNSGNLANPRVEDFQALVDYMEKLRK